MSLPEQMDDSDNFLRSDDTRSTSTFFVLSATVSCLVQTSSFGNNINKLTREYPAESGTLSKESNIAGMLSGLEIEISRQKCICSNANFYQDTATKYAAPTSAVHKETIFSRLRAL